MIKHNAAQHRAVPRRWAPQRISPHLIVETRAESHRVGLVFDCLFDESENERIGML
jgi:hypothetical protein